MISEYEARARLTAQGWRIWPFVAWPDEEQVPSVAWIEPGEEPPDDTFTCTWYAQGMAGEMPPVPVRVLEVAGLD